MMEFENLEVVKEKLNKISSSFCLAKWQQVTLHLYNGKTRSCHHVTPHVVETREISEDPSALHNSKFKKKQRQKMMKGQRPKECDYCWNIEDSGGTSDRVYKSREPWAWPYLDDVLKDKGCGGVNPSYVEVAFDSTCNLKCMYCGPVYSSKWHEEVLQHGAYPTTRSYNNLRIINEIEKGLPLKKEEREKYYRAFWDWWPSLSKSLRCFRVTGGEPLLSNHVWRVLDDFIAHPKPHLQLAINSNMSVPDSLVNRLIEKINALEGCVKGLELYVSVDTEGEQAEYIRFGLDYKRFVNNIEKVCEQVRWPITVSYIITVNALSLPGLKGLMSTIQGQRKRFPQHHIALDTPYLRNPQHLSVFILPQEFISYLQDTVEFMEENNFLFEEVDRLRRLVQYMKKDEFSFWRKILLRADFYKMFKEYDRRRGVSFIETFPEYEVFLKQCRKVARWIPRLYF